MPTCSLFVWQHLPCTVLQAYSCHKAHGIQKVLAWHTPQLNRCPLPLNLNCVTSWLHVGKPPSLPVPTGARIKKKKKNKKRHFSVHFKRPFLQQQDRVLRSVSPFCSSFQVWPLGSSSNIKKRNLLIKIKGSKDAWRKGESFPFAIEKGGFSQSSWSSRTKCKSQDQGSGR